MNALQEDAPHPLSVEVAIQGGGARLRTLIAALQVFQAAREVSMTKIVGTSAGAVAAMLYAAQVPMASVLTWMDERQSWTEVLPPIPPRNLCARLIHWSVNLFIDPDTRKTIKHLGICPGNAFLGYSLFDIKVFRKALVTFVHQTSELDIFRTGRLFLDTISFSQFREISGVELCVVRTNMDDGVSEVAPDDEFVLDAVVDSIAIPFAFRNIKDNIRRLDGGICANLAADQLAGPRRIAIGFREKTVDLPGSVPSLAVSLLSTAINNAVGEQIKGLGAANTLRLSSKYETFDFPKLFGPVSSEQKALQNQDASTATKEAMDFLQKWVPRSRAEFELDGDPWALALHRNDLASRSLKRRMEELARLAAPTCEIHTYDVRYELEPEQGPTGTTRVGAIVTEARLISPSSRPIRMGFVIPKDAAVLPGFRIMAYRENDTIGQQIQWIPALDPSALFIEGMHRLLLLDLSSYLEPIRIQLTYRARNLIQSLFELNGEEFGVNFKHNSLPTTRVKLTVRWPWPRRLETVGDVYLQGIQENGMWQYQVEAELNTESRPQYGFCLRANR